MNIRCLLAFVLGALAVSAVADAQLKVVATTPDLGSIAQMVGGEAVNVTSLARASEDPHFVTPRPSFVSVLNRADVLIEGGADLESGWLPPLVQAARNREILPGARGHIAVGRYVDLMGVPTGPIDRSQGHVHASGNPHFLLDPENGRKAAQAMAERFALLDPERAEVYAENLEQFGKRLDESLAAWTKRLAPFAGTKVVAYHENYDYLARRFGFIIVEEIESLAGIEPSPRQITRLITSMREEEIQMIWMEPFRPRRTPESVAEATGARLVLLPEQVGAVEGTEDYIALIDYNVRQIAAGMAAE